MSIVFTQTDVTNVAPELAAEVSTRFDIFSAIAISSINECAWGSKATYAAILLTCHLFTLANRGQTASGAGGAITENKVGDVQQSYGPQAPTADGELEATNYGRLYLMLRRSIVTTPLIV
jgi:hypothetical protein